jgi:predicted MFS family arabinose efflux permease
VATLNNIDRTLVLALAEPIKREFDLSDSAVGLLPSVFAISYSIVGIPVGMLVDRLNRVRLLAALLALWSAATVAGGFAQSFRALLLARIGLATAESGSVPASMSLITDLFPPARRGTAVGLYFFNNAIALGAGFAMSGIIARHFGWRAAFFITGTPGLILALFMVLALREPPRGAFEPRPTKPVAATQEPRPGIVAIVATVWRRRALALLAAAAVIVIAAQAGITTFVASFFIRVHHLPVDDAGIVVGLVLGAGFAIGSPLGGLLSDRLSRRSAQGGCRFVAAVVFLAAPFAIAAFLGSGVMISAAFLFLYATMGASFYAGAFSLYLGLAPAPMRGALGAFLMVLMNLAGYGLGPQLAGGISELAHHFGAADPLRLALSAMTLLLVVAAILFLAAGRAILAEERRAARA